MANKEHQADQKKDHSPEADFVIPVVNHDPQGNPIYHPAIGIRAFWGALIVGILCGSLAWLIASGTWPVTGLGQMASATPGVATYMGFVIGSAAGGLFGSLNGLRHMLVYQKYRSSEH